MYFFNSLGHKTYISLMKLAYAVIGNSSSGILETPSFGTNTINIGVRQNGRIMSSNIVSCGYSYSSIKKAFGKLKGKSKKKFLSPFFKEGTTQKIAKKIISFKYNLKKKFHNI